MHVDTPIKVRYAETDMMGVVYHANYLLYFEDSRLEFLNALDFSYNEEVEGAGFTSPIYSIQIDYKTPLHYGENAFVRTSISKNLPMKTIYHQQVFKAGSNTETGHPLVDAYITLCVVDRETFKPVNIKRTFPKLYEKYAEAIEE